MIEQGKAVFLNTYAQFPLVFVKGEGRTLYDDQHKGYLDLVGGIATNALGYGHKGYLAALKKVLDQGVVHVSNLYWNPYAIKAAKRIVELTQLSKVFFCNSGTEANEAAIKIARKYGQQKNQIICMEHSFHGRTYGSLSATGQTKYQSSFGPMLGGFDFVPFGDLQALEHAITEDTCAIMVEVIQGEGGIHQGPQSYWDALTQLCEKHNLLLICDEIQSGMGRTGLPFAYQGVGLKPDIVTMAKGLGGGLPIGAVACAPSVADVLVPGDHGSTFGGNLLATAAADYVLSQLQETDLLDHVKEVGSHLKKSLIQLQKEFPSISEIRGEGLMLAIQMDTEVRPIIEQCMKQGLLLANAGAYVLRMVPPLTITKEECDKAINVLADVLAN
ncbi:MAG: aspartate aminotransferase family protein [Sphaerochaetaceae bacterium]